jgi:hypothetical protein
MVAAQRPERAVQILRRCRGGARGNLARDRDFPAGTFTADSTDGSVDQATAVRILRAGNLAMRNQVVVTLALLLALGAGCAAHTPPAPLDSRTPAADDEAGSTASNILYAPGRGLLCGSSAVMAGVVMVVTLGQSYDTASELMHGGCSGPWVVRPSDIRQAVP